MDLLISSIVRSVDATLVSNNIREFGRVPDLRLENWKS
jgi:tRNA(fMet)-specific endonuclease VapC